MMRSILPVALVALAALGARADTLSIPEAGDAGMQMPARGLTMETVEERFGAPAQALPAIGDPPITRWVYPGFTVYFEHEFVIHPVPRTSHTEHAAATAQAN